MTFPNSLLVLLAPGLAATAAVVKTHLNISDGGASPDGHLRSAVLVNGQVPGPIIMGDKGDNFKINVINSLNSTSMEKTTTIHWHGLFQQHTPEADGPAFVTQCPIAPDHSFLYDFNVPNQAGTFWYHSHEGVQYCDGLRGPFVIYDPEDPHRHLYDVDDENTVITLADWYHDFARDIVPPKAANSVLINGRGRHNRDLSAPLAVINVDYGKRYRMRLVSTSCDPYFNFTIAGHNLTIIEADGENTEPLPGIDEVQIFAGQRYSFILNADRPIGNYLIRVIPDQVEEGIKNASFTPTGWAILHYAGAPDVDPRADISDIPTINTTESSAELRTVLLEQNLRALSGPPPGGLDPNCAACDLTLNFTFNNPKFYVNGFSYASPTIPVLLQILNGSYNAFDLMPKGSVYTLPRNHTIQISMPGGVLGITHPLHLHGHSFSVIKSAGSDVVNLKNPVRRDTVNIGSSPTDRVVVRFTTDNPGPWFLHCHIDFHLVAGMAVVMAEAPMDILSWLGPNPPKWEDLCPIYDTLSSTDKLTIPQAANSSRYPQNP